jgi:hypothetical protein
MIKFILKKFIGMKGLPLHSCGKCQKFTPHKVSYLNEIRFIECFECRDTHIKCENCKDAMIGLPIETVTFLYKRDRIGPWQYKKIMKILEGCHR